jgi:hypothetical protein
MSLKFAVVGCISIGISLKLCFSLCQGVLLCEFHEYNTHWNDGFIPVCWCFCDALDFAMPYYHVKNNCVFWSNL